MRRLARVRRIALGLILLPALLVASSFQVVRADGTTGAYFVRGAYCSGPELLVNPPFIAAVDVTPGEDAQPVTWRPVLYKWDGSTWALVSAYSYEPAYWAYDGDGGRYTYRSDRRMVLMTSNGYYRVAIQIYWYATANTPSGSAYVWGGSHYTVVGGVRETASYCTRSV